MQGTIRLSDFVWAIALLLLVLIPAMTTMGQLPQPVRPSFEVASIKPNPPNETRVFMTGVGDTYIATGASLKTLIGYAFRARDFQIVGATDWIASDRWEIVAKAPEGSIPLRPVTVDLNVPDTKALMLQSLLEDRFKLKIHRELRQLPVYELVVVKDGAKIRLSEDQGPIVPPAAGSSPVPRPGEKLTRGSYWASSGKFEATAIPLERFVSYLVPHLDGPVIDKTGLQGLYDFSLRYEQSPGSFAFASPDVPVDVLTGPSIYTALREQLGLQLNREKGPVEVIVIDSAQKPTPN